MKRDDQNFTFVESLRLLNQIIFSKSLSQLFQHGFLEKEIW